MKVAIIIITHNNAKTIERCLNGFFKNESHDFELKFVLIDNASCDDSPLLIKKHSQRISAVLVENKTNTGFSAGVNQGITLAKNSFDPDYFLLFNPDAFLEQGALRRLIDCLEKNSRCGVCGPLIINFPENKVWFCGGKISWIRMRSAHQNCSDVDKEHPTARSDVLSGCAMLISRTALEKIGLFDENFFLYYEDADFSLRAVRAGFQPAIVFSAICRHYESQSFRGNEKLFHLVKSGLIFFHKHYPFWALPFFWSLFSLRLCYHAVFGKKFLLPAFMEFWKMDKTR